MRTEVLVGPHQGSRAPGTQALCTMSPPTSDIFPLEQLPTPWEGVGWTSPWTHKPVHPAEVLSPLLLQAQTTLCWFLPLQGNGAASSFLCPFPSGSVPEMGVSNLLFPSRKESCPPSPSGRAELGEGLAAFLSSTCPSFRWSVLEPLDVPALPHPEYYIALVSVCMCACVRACAFVPL